jgi:hypothetical protein
MALEANRTRNRIDHPQDGLRSRGLAAPRLPDQAERFPGLQRERDSVDSVDPALRSSGETLRQMSFHWVTRVQVLDLKQSLKTATVA